MSKKTLGILTGGGDCPGLNSAIKSATIKALQCGYEVLGIKNGWHGLLDPKDNFWLDFQRVEEIDAFGGTILGTSRTNPYKTKDGPSLIQKNFLENKLSALIAIGGEDTLGVAQKLHQDYALPIVGIPKTIDKDLSATDYTLGFLSAVEVITKSIDNLRTTAKSHSRVMVVEVMGRHAGHLALLGGISAGALMILIPEYDFDLDKIYSLIKSPSIIVIAEGAKAKNYKLTLLEKKLDEFGHMRLGGIGESLSINIEKNTGFESRCVSLSHLQRGGTPVAFDRLMGHYFGIAAVEAIISNNFGFMTALKDGKVKLAPLSDAIKALCLVDVEKKYDINNYQALNTILER